MPNSTKQKAMLRFIIGLLGSFIFSFSYAQSVALPHFLRGTWKIDGKTEYEHWDLINENTLKGFAYSVEHGQIKVSEYLEISFDQNSLLYKAIVLGQNNGQAVCFKNTRRDSIWSFENPNHDFPKTILYQKTDYRQIKVKVTDNQKKGFEYSLQKVELPISETDTTIKNKNFDAVLAHELDADDYGMKMYTWVILKTGPNSDADKQKKSASFRGHLDNIRKLVEEKKLLVAGPLSKNEKNYRGIFILNIKDQNEADRILESDPAIREGYLAYECFPWYGSAALIEYLKYADKIWKVNP
jgi:uncharacterized protein YciI